MRRVDKEKISFLGWDYLISYSASWTFLSKCEFQNKILYHEGGLISFCYPDDIEFAQARVKKVLGNKRFGDFINEDWRGYEKFSSEEERNRIYSNWNRIEVNDDTLMGILIYDNFQLTGEVRES